MATLTNKRPRSDSDGDEIDTSTIFRSQENFAKFLIIESTKIGRLHLYHLLLLKNK